MSLQYEFIAHGKHIIRSPTSGERQDIRAAVLSWFRARGVSRATLKGLKHDGLIERALDKARELDGMNELRLGLFEQAVWIRRPR